MIRFLDGPAFGQALMLHRAPLYLRAVFGPRKKKEQWDALDQLDDEPKAGELVTVYRRVGPASACMVDWSQGGRRRGGRFAMAAYQVVAEQPDDATARDTQSWRAWCVERQKIDAGNPPGDRPLSPEAAHLAAATWLDMFRGSMPPAFALDRVQDETGDRSDALRALVGAAAVWLRGHRPEGVKKTGSDHTAALIADVVAMGALDVAEEYRRAGALATARQFSEPHVTWRDWFHDARRAIRLCSELTAAANPPVSA